MLESIEKELDNIQKNLKGSGGTEGGTLPQLAKDLFIQNEFGSLILNPKHSS